MRLLALGILAALTAGADSLRAQGLTEYCNFEIPGVDPIRVARFANRDLLLVCDTPDNSLRIYDTSSNSLLWRIPVGLAPVSVLDAPHLTSPATRHRLWTANQLGDSITRIELVHDPVSNALGFEMFGSQDVGDEPVHMSLDGSGQFLFVAKRSFSSFATVNATTLLPPGGPNDLNLLMTDAGLLPLTPNPSVPGVNQIAAIKEPQRIEVRGLKLYALGKQGGKGGAFDFDVWSYDFASSSATILKTPATTNFAMAFDGASDLYVVGTEAQTGVPGESALRVLPTGFVKSMIYKFPAGSTTPLSLDLNLGTTQKSDSLAHPTDVKIYAPAGEPAWTCITAFHSDNVAMLDTSSATPGAWTIKRAKVVVPGMPATRVAGPRALAVKLANPSRPQDPGDRLYVLNTLYPSVAIFDPTGSSLTQVGTILLHPPGGDPVPDYVRTGQPFLYSTKFSGNGFVSCASCHVDGISDWQLWDLSPNDDATPLPLPFYPHEFNSVLAGDPNQLQVMFDREFPVDKGPMITQSLQGLMNFEANGNIDSLVQNAPLHWRGDKASFLDFNEAFVNLQGMTPVAPGSHNGLTDSEMEAFESFIHSVHYPPNPEQAKNRRFTGSLGDPNDTTSGSGALRGMKLFFQQAYVNLGNRSCAMCHALTEGSNNRLTEFLAGGLASPTSQPLETAALRGLRQKEMSFAVDGTTLGAPLVRTGDHGLGHAGTLSGSINEFVGGGFFQTGPGTALTAQQAMDIASFVRQMDHGVAPIVGWTQTVDSSNSTDTAVLARITLMENQVKEANAGLSVHAWIGSTMTGFWFRITGSGSPGYQVEGQSSSPLSRSALINTYVTQGGGVLVFQATPLGDDRRVSSVGGSSTILGGVIPATFAHAGSSPNTAYVDVPSLDDVWIGGLAFPLGSFPSLWAPAPWVPPLPVPASISAALAFQQDLSSTGPMPGVAQRHEASRRLRFTSPDLVEGAMLTLVIPGSLPTNPATVRPSDHFITMALYPRLVGGSLVWETAVEFDGLEFLTLCMGGPAAPGVLDHLRANSPPAAFQWQNWNQYVAILSHPNGTFAQFPFVLTY